MDSRHTETRAAMRALLDGTNPAERRELALDVAEQALALSHEGEGEIARAVGMSLTLLAASMAHVAALEVELVKVRETTGRYEDWSAGVVERHFAELADLRDRLGRLEQCPEHGGAA